MDLSESPMQEKENVKKFRGYVCLHFLEEKAVKIGFHFL